MSDCESAGHGSQWVPAARCTQCGHRAATAVLRPVETRQLPLRYWPFELAARFVARHPVTEMIAIGPATDTCRHCGKPIRREQREWATVEPLDGAPWYCRGNPAGENRHEPAEAL